MMRKMMRKIHKLRITPLGTDYRLPRGAKIIQFCKDGNDNLCIWYIFSVSEWHVHTKRELRIFGTNHEIPDGYEHLGTAICGLAVWHLFERK